MSGRVVVYGAGGSSRDILDVLEAAGREVAGFVDDDPRLWGKVVNGVPVLGGHDRLEDLRREGHEMVCGLGDAAARRRVVRRLAPQGWKFATVVHPSAVVTRRVTLGEGVVVPAGCVLTNNVRLGHHVQLNVACTVSHDCVLEDFVTLAPGVHLSGNVHAEEGAFFGTGANVIQGIRVGRWAVVGAGATVVRPVPPNVTVVGVPARVVRERPEGWHESPVTLKEQNHDSR